jgi:hypothetical protein
VTRVRLLGLLLLASLAATLSAAAMPERVLAGDAISYRQRMGELFAGQWPYLDFDFEHLPGAVVPMAAAWVLGGSSSLSAYAISLSIVSMLLLAITAWVLYDLETILPPGLAWRWLLAVIPLLPFLLFRNDAWSVLLLVAAFWVGATRAGDGSGWAWVGVLTKFWPVVWAVVEWWRGKRARAVMTVLLGLGMLFLLRSGPVLRVQRPTGIHSETLASSVLGIFGHLSGVPPVLRETSALYMEASWWAHLINLLPASALILIVLLLKGAAFDWRRAWLMTGVLVGSVIIASPLLSTQFVSWLTPFAASKPTFARQMFVINLLSLLMILNYDDAVSGELTWFLLALARNVLLLFLLLFMAVHLIGGQRQLPSIQQVNA